jgi:hypothetical protein
MSPVTAVMVFPFPAGAVLAGPPEQFPDHFGVLLVQFPCFRPGHYFDFVPDFHSARPFPLPQIIGDYA